MFRAPAKSLTFAAALLLALAASADEPSGELSERLKSVTFDHYAEAPGYSEGPTWRNGEDLLCSGALLRVDEQRKVHKYLEINPTGTLLCGDGRLLMCENNHKALVCLFPDRTLVVMTDHFPYH